VTPATRSDAHIGTLKTTSATRLYKAKPEFKCQIMQCPARPGREALHMTALLPDGIASGPPPLGRPATAMRS
jgi:hypothetical protein